MQKSERASTLLRPESTQKKNITRQGPQDLHEIINPSHSSIKGDTETEFRSEPDTWDGSNIESCTKLRKCLNSALAILEVQESKVHAQSSITENLKTEVELLRKQMRDKEDENEERTKALDSLFVHLLEIISDVNRDNFIEDSRSRYLSLRVLGFEGNETDEVVEKEYGRKYRRQFSLWHPDKWKDPSIKRLAEIYIKCLTAVISDWKEYFSFESLWAVFESLCTEYTAIFEKRWQPSRKDEFHSQSLTELIWNVEAVRGEISTELFAQYNVLRNKFEDLNGEPWNSDTSGLDNPEKLDGLKQEIQYLKDALKNSKGDQNLYVR